LPLTHSFCKHVVELQEALIVGDAREHPLLKDNPAIKELGAVAYAGMPLVTPEGHILGTLCFVDTKPREWNLQSGSIVFHPKEKASQTPAVSRGNGSEPRSRRGGRQPVLDAHADLIRSLRGAKPNISASEIQAELEKRGITVRATSTIRRWLARAGLTADKAA
jgi:hypothetical protein